MKKLLLTLSITLGLSSLANANAVYECSLFDEGQSYAQMIKYENKLVEIFPTLSDKCLDHCSIGGDKCEQCGEGYYNISKLTILTRNNYHVV